MGGVVWEAGDFFDIVPVVVDFCAGLAECVAVNIVEEEDTSARGVDQIAWCRLGGEALDNGIGRCFVVCVCPV